MNFRISAALIATLVAAVGLLTPETKPNPIEAARRNNLGAAYMNQQLFEKGLKAFQQASEADPSLAIARLNQGIAYLNLQKVDEAKAAFEDALKQDPKNPNAWYGLGMLAKNTGDAPAAIDAFKRVTEIDPNDADTWYFLGTAYVQAKQFPQAIEAFQRALQLNPLHASAEFGLSRAYQQSSDVDRSNLDHAREHLKKFQYITQNKVGAPMSLAYGEQGQYSRAVESPSAVLKAPPQIKVRFVDVTKEAGILTVASPRGSATSEKGAIDRHAEEALVGTGACLLDYDGGGLPDIFLADDGPQGGLGLFRNLGNGHFEDVTTKAGLDPSLHGIGCTAGDYDNDGATDLAVSFRHRIVLFHNEKTGTFKDVTEASGIRADGLNVGLTFVDYDHDGDLDLFIARASVGALTDRGGEWEDQLWRNDGNGKFTDVTQVTGFATRGFHTAAIGTDYNNDRAVDIVLTGRTPIIFENPREGKFPERKPWSGSFPDLTLGVAPLDFNHDGWTDLAFNLRPLFRREE